MKWGLTYGEVAYLMRNICPFAAKAKKYQLGIWYVLVDKKPLFHLQLFTEMIQA